jgi:hypothetical protein
MVGQVGPENTSQCELEHQLRMVAVGVEEMLHRDIME